MLACVEIYKKTCATTNPALLCAPLMMLMKKSSQKPRRSPLPAPTPLRSLCQNGRTNCQNACIRSNFLIWGNNATKSVAMNTTNMLNNSVA